MAKPPAIVDVVEEMYQSILATPKRQRRLLSKTFWDKFGFKMRTKERVAQVRDALSERGLIVNLDSDTFGTEGKDEWVILTYVEPPKPHMLTPHQAVVEVVPTPPASWFKLLRERAFESEREVEYYFILPLVEQLGYTEADFCIGYPVQMYEGVKKVRKEADFVLFNGSSRAKDDALLVVEAKKAERGLTEDAVGQARAYSLWLATPYYLVTNGDETRVYLLRGPVQPDVMLMSLDRQELEQNWQLLYKTLSKTAVLDYKKRFREMLEKAQAR